MPKEGFRSVTVSEDLYAELKDRAKKEGLSLPQVIETYKMKAESINQLLWLETPQGIAQRLRELTASFRQLILDRRNQEWAKNLRLQGKDPLGEIRPIEEINQWETEAHDLAVELANLTVEKDNETYQELQKQYREDNIKYFLKQASNRPKEVVTDSVTGLLQYVTYKTNAEVVEEQLRTISDRLEAIFSEPSEVSPLQIMRENIIAIGDLANQWTSLRKYVPYLSDQGKDFDQKISKHLGD